MSFYFDDDNDDHALSQVFQMSSQQQKKQVTFSQASSTAFLSQFSSDASPQKQNLSQQSTSPSQSFSQKSILSSISNANNTPSKSSNNDTKTFVCHNCGAVDEYYRDAGGLITCSRCFTQSQDYGALQEELDYDETQHMAARNRDGTLKRVNSKSLRATNPDGSFRQGRPAIPLEELDSTQKPPSLQACLRGFQSALQKACKILCLELLPTLALTTQSSTAKGNDESDNDIDATDEYIPGNQTNAHQHYSKQKEEEEKEKTRVYRQVSKTVRDMWKAYLLSWKEGADFYSKLYPQMRFALRDQFLRPKERAILYQTLAARVEEKMTQQIKKEVQEEEANESDGESSNTTDSGSDSDDESYTKRRNKKIKLEDSYNRSKNTESDSLCNFHVHSHDAENIKTENVVSEDEIPIPDVVLSNEPKTSLSRPSKTSIHHYHSRRKRLPWNHQMNDCDNNIIKEQEEDDSDSDHDNADANDNFSVASDLSIADAAEHKRKGISSRKRKRTKQKEMKFANSTNPFAKMIYFHNKMMHQETKSKKVPQLGRKEAALLIKPSMELILVFLLVAASPHGLTEFKLAEWVGNGSLPILDAFRCLLSERQQTELSMLAFFFSLPKAPDAAVLKFLTRKIHVACGYKPPKVKLMRPNRRTKGRTLDGKSLVAAGRLVRPSSVPMILGHLVSELGLSQRVLNYSLALMGLPVSICALKAAEVPIPRGRGRPRQDGTHLDVAAEWDSEESPIFDLTRSSERQRRRRYLNKLAQRRRRAKLRQKMGLTVHTLYRNKKYCGRNVHGGITDCALSGASQDLQTESPDLCSSELVQENDKEQTALNKENTEWLPPALRRARPDKLVDIDQILAVVIVACKLIPNWEKNHHYVFSHGRASIGKKTMMGNEMSTIGEYGSGDKAKADPKDRFVPWNHDEFCRIGNGKTESEYLKFLKECIFRGHRYALPKFVESLSKLHSLPSDDLSTMDEEEDLNEILSDPLVQQRHNTSVVPNDVVLGWKKNPQFSEHQPSLIRDTLGRIRVPYQPTKSSDTSGHRRPAGPLGPLIEYMACKTGTCPIRILDQLLELDEELALKGKPETSTLSLPPNACYNHFMGEIHAGPSVTKKDRTQSRKRTRRAQSTDSAPQADPRETNNHTFEDAGDLFLSTEAQHKLGGNDNIPKQMEFPQNDDLSSVASVYEV